jgi:hypothetical protein
MSQELSMNQAAEILVMMRNSSTFQSPQRNKIQNKRSCVHPGCSITANYGFKGTRQRLYCATHGKPKGMVNIGLFSTSTNSYRGKCIEPGCNISANYNLAGMRQKLYCATHGRPRGMVNVCINRTVQAAASTYLFH